MAQDNLVAGFLTEHGPGGHTRFNTGVNALMREMLGLMWPTAGLPEHVKAWSCGLPGPVLYHIGALVSQNFANVNRALGWLVLKIPDNIPMTREAAHGSLAGTVHLTRPLDRSAAFDLVDLRANVDWLSELQRRDTT